MICSRSSKSANNKIYTFSELECLIKLLYPIRSNINNTNVLLLAHFVDKKNQNNAFTKKEDRERKSEGRLLKTVQLCKHEFKAPAGKSENI